MTGTVAQWVQKAEGDFVSATALLRLRKKPQHDSVCFHAQQCVEKLMKAALVRRKVAPAHTHDLVQLSVRLAAAVGGWTWDPKELRTLTASAVTLRYPGHDADRAEALNAMKICRNLRRALLKLL